MARKPTGAVIEHIGRDGRTYRSLRFSAYGKRRFVALGAIDREDAERKLRIALDQVAEGIWQPPQPVQAPPETTGAPTFHQYAEQWWTLHVVGKAKRTEEDYRWRLEHHLLGYFGEMPLDKITLNDVLAYKAAKLREDLKPRTINMTLDLLERILGAAVDEDLIPRNPVRGEDKRVRGRKPQRTQLDSAESISALIEAAAAMDAERGDHIHRKAIVTTLLGAGLRIGELCDLRWGAVNLAGSRIRVEASKTDAGRRDVTIRGIVRDALAGIKPADVDPNAYVFGTRNGTQTGGRMNPSNFRNRVLGPARDQASERLMREGYGQFPHLTPHSCRRTFCSWLYALGEQPPVVMAEMGHESPQLALAVYAQAMRRSEEEKQRLRALMNGDPIAEMADERQTSENGGSGARSAEAVSDAEAAD